MVPLAKNTLKLKLRHLRKRPQQILLNIGVKSLQLLALRARPLDIPILLTKELIIDIALLASINIKENLKKRQARIVDSHQLVAFACELQLVSLRIFFACRGLNETLLALRSRPVSVIQKLQIQNMIANMLLVKCYLLPLGLLPQILLALLPDCVERGLSNLWIAIEVMKVRAEVRVIRNICLIIFECNLLTIC